MTDADPWKVVSTEKDPWAVVSTEPVSKVGFGEALGRSAVAGGRRVAAGMATTAGALTDYADTGAGDPLMKFADEQRAQAAKEDIQPNEELTGGGVAGEIIGGAPAGVLAAPFGGQEAAVQRIQQGGTAGDAAESAAAGTAAAIPQLLAPELGGRVGGAILKGLTPAAARPIIQEGARLVGKAAGGAATAIPAQAASTAIENVARPDDQQQPLMPEGGEAAESVGAGALFGLGAHADNLRSLHSDLQAAKTPEAIKAVQDRIDKFHRGYVAGQDLRKLASKAERRGDTKAAQYYRGKADKLDPVGAEQQEEGQAGPAPDNLIEFGQEEEEPNTEAAAQPGAVPLTGEDGKPLASVGPGSGDASLETVKPEAEQEAAPAASRRPEDDRLDQLKSDLEAAATDTAKKAVQARIDAVAKQRQAAIDAEAKAKADAEAAAKRTADAAALRALADKAAAEGREDDRAHYAAQAEALEPPEAPTVEPEKINMAAEPAAPPEPKAAGTETEPPSPATKPAPVATNEPGTATPSPPGETITPEARSLLETVDKGGVPFAITNNLRRIAKDNGIEVTGKTSPSDIINQLRTKSAVKETAVPDAANKDGLPIKTGENVGLAAAMSEDGRTSLHDKNMPDTVQATHTHPETGVVSQQPFNLRESRDYHERVEDAEIQAGKDYYEAHRVATEAEHSRMRQLGFDPNEIEKLQEPYIDKAAHEARARGNTTPEAGTEPYRVSGEAGMREDGQAPDNRFVLDRDGNKYTDPVHGKLLKNFEVVTAQGEDGTHAVLDPNSGKVLARGKTREEADAAAEAMAVGRGRIRMKKFLEKEPQQSQQQLREKYKTDHPEARIGAEATTVAPKEKSDEEGNARQDEGKDAHEGKDADGQGQNAHEEGQVAEPVKGTKRARQPLQDARLESPQHRAELERMADNAGWAQIGGQLVRASDESSLNDDERNNPRYAKGVGEVTGRTPWVPNEPWFADVQRSSGLPKNKSGAATREAVRKALAGDPLTVRESRHVQALLDEADARRTEEAAFHEERVKPTDQDRENAAAVQHAISIDPDAVERASVQFENDTPAFMAEVKRITDENASRIQESDTAPAGQGGEARPGDEGGTVQEDGNRPAADTEDRPTGQRPDSANDAGSAERDASIPFSLELERHTNADLDARERAKRDAEAAERRRVAEEEKKAKADEEAKDFKLTGSNRTADVAMATGQKPLFKMAEGNRTPAEASKSVEPNSIEDLQTKMSAALGKDVSVSRVSAPDRASRSLAGAVRRMFGREVVFFKADTDAARGVYIGGGKLYVNVDAAKPYSQIIGHELLHSIRDEAPQVYNRLVSDLASSLKGDAAKGFKEMAQKIRKDRGMAPLRDGELHEELIADVMGDHFADPAFIRELQKHLEPELYRRLLAHIADFIDKARAKFTGTPEQMGRQAARLVSDLETARSAVNQALADIGRQSRAERAGGREPAFSLAERKKQTDTPEFKKWFGESKVVDDDGKPLVVYHGTGRDIKAFDQNAPRSVQAFNDAQGFYFTSEPAIAGHYGAGNEHQSIYPTYLSIENPKIVKNDSYEHTYITPKDKAVYEAQGHDGLIFRDPSGKRHDEYVAFRPEQIKSAIGNSGEFNPKNPDIAFSLEGEEPTYGYRITGIKHATVDEERKAKGLPPLESEARKGFEQSWEDAERRMSTDPTVVQRTVDELLQKPRPLNDVENAMLLRQRVTLHNAYHKSMDLINDAGTPDDVVREESLNVARMEDQMNDLDRALRLAGTEQGRGLAARKMMAKEDYTLASMMQQMRAAKQGEVLTPKERADTEKLNKRIADLEEQLAKHTEKADQAASKDQGKEVVEALKSKVKAEDVADKKAGRERAPKKDAGEIVKGMKKDFTAGKPLQDMGSYIQKLCESFIRQGVDKLDPLIDAVHKTLVQHVDPNITKRQTMDAISGYGDFKKLNPDLVKTKLRDLRGQAQQVAKLQDIEAGKPPLKTGVERREPSDEERHLIQMVNEAKRRFGVVDTGAGDALKSALDSIKTRLRNQISDMDFQIAAGKKFVDEKSKVQYDAEAKELKAHRDLLKKQFDEIFAKPDSEMTDEQRIAAATKAVKASIDRYEERIKAKDFAPKDGKPAPTTPELDALRARRDALKDEYQMLKNSDALVQRAKAEKMELQTRQRIDELNRKIQTGDVSNPVKAERLTTPELEKLREERDALTKQYAKMRRDAMTPEQKNAIALQAFKTRIKGMIADTLERTARGDFAPKERRPLVLDQAGQALQAQMNGAKKEFQRGKLKLRLANRTSFEKFADRVNKIHRAEILSSPLVLAKLTSAAFTRMLSAPLEEAVGGVISKALPDLAKRAPREGGINLNAEAKAAREGFMNYLKHVGEYYRTGGDTEKSLLYGHGDDGSISEKDVQPKSPILDFFGTIHGALKNPVKEAEFARAYEKIAKNYAANNVDISNEAVKMQIGVEAWKEANRSIFLQDNVVTNAYNSMLSYLERPDKEGHANPAGKAIALGMRTLLPIVKVPTNVVAETMQYALGSVTGGAKLALAIRKGIENLPPEKADVILRELKKGSIGAALLAVGYMNPDTIGGYYQSGEKRRPSDVKAGRIKLYGADIPSWLLHSPLLETLQIGATLRRVSEQRISKKHPDRKGMGEGVEAGAWGLTEELPFVREMLDVSKIKDDHSHGFTGELAKSLLIPQIVQFVAREMDRDKPMDSIKDAWEGETVPRTAKTFKQHIETGVPVARQLVPRSKGSRPPAHDFAKEFLKKPEAPPAQDLAAQ